jgi:hypothetical protein
VPASSRPAVPSGELDKDVSESSPHLRDDTGLSIAGEENELQQRVLLLAQRVSQVGEYVVPDPEFVDISRVVATELTLLSDCLCRCFVCHRGTEAKCERVHSVP